MQIIYIDIDPQTAMNRILSRNEQLTAFEQEKLDFWQRLFFMPALWVFLEFSRSYFLTGFPWNLLAYSQTSNLFAIQAADLFGAFGVSFMVMFTNIIAFEILHSRSTKNPLKPQQLPLSENRI